MEPLQRINTITKKLQHKLNERAILQKENEVQQKKIKELEQSQVKLIEEIRLLTEQNQILKVASGNMTEADKKNLENTINKYLKEIDKCISLLSE